MFKQLTNNYWVVIQDRDLSISFLPDDVHVIM